MASDTIPTYAYNWCVSPLTPMGVSGVIWVPSEANLGEDPRHYASELEVYAASLSATYGQESVPFFYAQPSDSLVPGITAPDIPGAQRLSFDQWPKSLKGLAAEMADWSTSRRPAPIDRCLARSRADRAPVDELCLGE